MYDVGEEFYKISNLLFSDQTPLAYTEAYKSKFETSKTYWRMKMLLMILFIVIKKNALGFLLEKELISMDVN